MAPVDQFPMFKLGTLLARQLSAPLAARIKAYAKAHPLFSRHVCARVAVAYGEAEVRVTRAALRMYGAEPVRLSAPPLSDAQARTIGGDILGEVIVFALGAAIIVFEVNRQAAKQELKKQEARARWAALRGALQELGREAARQQAALDALRAALRDLELRPPPPPPPPPPEHHLWQPV